MTIYILSITVVWSRGGPGRHRSWCGHISVISLVGGLWVQEDRHGAAGAAPVCCGAPVDGEVVVAGATGAFCTGGHFGTGGDFCTVNSFCTGGAPGHSSVAGATSPGEDVSFLMDSASGCSSQM